MDKKLARILVAVVLAAGVPAARAADPATSAAGDPGAAKLSGIIRLVLEGGAIGGKGNKTVDLALDLTCQEGQWRKDVFGRAPEMNRGEHFGRIQSLRHEGPSISAEVLLEIDGDPWSKGYVTTYRLEFQLRDTAIDGRYESRIAGNEIRNKLTGHVLPWPAVAPGFVPPAAGEHPRLLLRRRDLPRLKALATTEWGKAWVDRMKAARKEDPGMVRNATNVYLPKEIPDYGLKMGLLYVITGEQDYADRCRQVIVDLESGGGTNMDQSTRWTVTAMVFDLAYDGLPPEFRARVARRLQRAMLSNVLRSVKSEWIHPHIYLAMAAVWDEPLSLPAEPAEPVMARVSPPAGLETPEGTPKVELTSGKTMTEWLFAGPLVAYHDREDHLVLKDRREFPSPGPHFQTDGQDFLASLGGWRSAQPAKGAAVAYQGQTAAFGPLDAKAIRQQGEAVVLDIWTAHQDVPVSAGYYYAVIENKQDGWYTMLLEPDQPAARAFYDSTTQADADAPFRLDADVCLAGQVLHHGDVVHLTAGRYPAMLRATTCQRRIQLQPRLAAVSEAQALANHAARQKAFPDRRRYWEQGFENYRRPMYAICQRVFHRLEKLIEHDDILAASQEGSGPWGICTLNMASLAHVNVTGRRLSYAPLRLCAYAGIGCGTDDEFATGFRTLPEAYWPGVLWAWQRRPDYGQNTVFALLSRDPETTPRNPLGVLPNPYKNDLTGFHLFRNAWRDADDCTADIYFKCWPSPYGVRPNAGSFHIRGLGHEWACRGTHVFHMAGGLGATGGESEVRLWEENVVQFPLDPINNEAGGRMVHFSGQADGSGVATADMDDVVAGCEPQPFKAGRLRPALWDAMGRLRRERMRDLGIRWRRSFAVDYSGACGAPAMLITADKASGGKRKYWQMLVAENPEVSIDGRTFTLRHTDGASLVGTVVSPPQAKISFVNGTTTINAVRIDGAAKDWKTNLRAIQVEGGDDFFIVMTLQKGEAPKVSVDGTGLAARAQVGRQAVAFDGQKIVLTGAGE
jgi:hypothetical protein